MGRPGCVRGRQTGVGLALDPWLGCSLSWPRSSSAAHRPRGGDPRAASCRPARSSRRTPGGCTAASRAPTRWPATASTTRWPTRRRPTGGSPRPAPTSELPPFLGVPCTIKESIALARDAQLRRPGGAARAPLRDHRPRGAAAARRGLHPARRDEHVGADDVDRVRQPRLRAHAQRLRPAPHRRWLVGRRGRGGRLGRLAGRARARTSAARSACPRSSTASSATSRRRAWCRTRASSPTPSARRRGCSRSAR